MRVDTLNEYDVAVRMLAKACKAAEDEELKQLRECVRPWFRWDNQPERREEQASMVQRSSEVGDAVLAKLHDMLTSYCDASKNRQDEICDAVKKQAPLEELPRG